MLIDEYLPQYDVVEHHEIVVNATSDATYRAIKNIDFARSPVIVGLLAIRTIPRLFRREMRLARPRLTLSDLANEGFVVLAEEPDSEIVLGVVGRFWRPDSGIRRIDAADFKAFAESGFAKGAWNFAVVDQGDGSTRAITETRVQCTDAAARRRFLAYWRLIGPFSALIRRLILRQVKHEAERESAYVPV